jgi:hypothetical protein
LDHRAPGAIGILVALAFSTATPKGRILFRIFPGSAASIRRRVIEAPP